MVADRTGAVLTGLHDQKQRVLEVGNALAEDLGELGWTHFRSIPASGSDVISTEEYRENSLEGVKSIPQHDAASGARGPMCVHTPNSEPEVVREPCNTETCNV